MTIDDYEVRAKWVDPSDDSKAYHDFIYSKIGINWLETHLYISKYCLQIALSTTLKQHNTMHTKKLARSLSRMICMRMKKRL